MCSMPGSNAKHQARTTSNVAAARQSMAGGQRTLRKIVYWGLPANRLPLSAVEVIRSLTATTVIPKLDKLFSEFGVPETVRSDNGPPFNGKDFRHFAMNLGFLHRKVTPLWPRANGEVERFVATVKKVVTATVKQKPLKEELIKFLRNNRATPHTSTGKAPATTLFNRPMRVKLPEAQTGSSDHADIKHQDDKAKRKMKECADRKSYVKPYDVRVGDTMLVKRDKSYRTSLTPYDPKPYEVTESKGSMVTASNGEKMITRNSSFFKPIKNDEPDAPDTPDANKLVDEPEASQPATEDGGRRYPQRSQRKLAERFKDYVTN